MDRTKLDRPTVGEMVALLRTLPQHMPFRIDDPDTNWTIHQVWAYVEGDRFWLTGDYCDMSDEEQLPPRDPPALSHAAGQDGEQCRAASGEVLNRIADELELLVQSPFRPTRNQCREWVAEIRALSRGVPEDTKRMDWLVANVTETLTAKSIQGEFPHPEHKTQYVLPRLIAWADFHGQVGFREAIDYAIAAQRKEGQ